MRTPEHAIKTTDAKLRQPSSIVLRLMWIQRRNLLDAFEQICVAHKPKMHRPWLRQNQFHEKTIMKIISG